MAKRSEIKHLLTEAGEKLCGNEWDVYPRPTLVRDSFFSLNGEWNLLDSFGKNVKITVPYPPESILSGVGRSMGKQPILTYSRKFTLPEGFVKDRVILHFGAADQLTAVRLNGILVGTHTGGYEHFSFDITDALKDGENRIIVTVMDNLCTKHLPYGKQSNNRGGMWYTPISGIWQTVWIESVPENYVRLLSAVAGKNNVLIIASGVKEGEITIKTPNGYKHAKLNTGMCIVHFDDPVTWSPENPYLYRFTLKAGEDTVSSYFAFRDISIGEVDGTPRILLNGKPYFFHGVLDQGYYSDGIYLPATPAEYVRDIKRMKALGFNTLRKHIKLEPELFYYYCDKLGMIVFQDMINNGDYSFFRDTLLPTLGLKRLNDRNLHKSEICRKHFRESMHNVALTLRNHPSVCYYTIFNEGWGQFCSDELYDELKNWYNSGQIIDSTSGWFYGEKSDVDSLHVYFRPVRIKPSTRPIILSEFGGYSYKPRGHVANEKRTYGYGFYKSRRALEDAIAGLYENEIIPQIEKGLCGAIYTQLSDVEDETNGLISYDRKVVKVSARRMREIAERLKIKEK